MLLPLVLSCLFAFALTCGCSSQESDAASTDAADAPSEDISEQQSGEAGDSAADDAEATADVEAYAEAQNSHEFDVPSDEEALRNDEWADGIVRDGLTTLVDESVIEPLDYDAFLLDDAFQYDYADVGFGIAFQDGAAAEELLGSYTLPEGKVIIGYADARNGVIRVAYANGDWGDGDWPLFFPESLFGYFDMYQMSDAFSDAPVDTFANSIDECDYLIVYDSVYSHVDEDFYDDTFDRTAATTLVFVIDVDSGRVVHIENVGTDMPGNFVDITETSGDMLWDDLAAYLHDLLTDRSEG